MLVREQNIFKHDINILAYYDYYRYRYPSSLGNEQAAESDCRFRALGAGTEA